MSGDRPEDAKTAAAVEALVRAIEAKEARASKAASGPQDPNGKLEQKADASTPYPGRRSPASARRSQTQTSWTWQPAGPGPMPGLIDRQQWKAAIQDEAERQSRYGRPCAVFLAELDGLDGHGGPGAANWLVPRFTGLLVSLTRASDRITRLTGARFGILLLEADALGASRFAARANVAADAWLTSSPWPVRLVVAWAGATSPDELRLAVRTAEAQLARLRA